MVVEEVGGVVVGMCEAEVMVEADRACCKTPYVRS